MSNMTPAENKAENAYRTLLTYAQRTEQGDSEVEAQMTSLMCDMMHLSDQYSESMEEMFAKAKAMYLDDLK